MVMRSPSLTGMAAVLAALLIVLLCVAGCTQQAASPYDAVNGVKAYKTDDSHITVTYVGAPGMDGLLELEITITDSNGKSLTQSRGDRLGTTPVQIPTTQSFTGSYGGKAHVFITGHFANGSRSTLLDKDL